MSDVERKYLELDSQEYKISIESNPTFFALNISRVRVLLPQLLILEHSRSPCFILHRKVRFVLVIKMEKNLVLICIKEFRIPVAAKGCGAKYRNKILSEESKAILRYLLDRKQNVEVSDETQFCKVYDSIKEAVEGF